MSMRGTRTRKAGSGNSIRPYFHDIKDESLLTASEECALAEAIAQGDSEARPRMIQANLRLVVKIAGGYSGRGVILDDLIGEGNVGLIRAVEQFRPRFGTRFSTYASYWIKQSIRRALVNTTPMIRIPAHMVGLMNKWRRAERALAREQGSAPSFNEVASFLGLSKAQSSLVFKAHKARELKLESCLVADAGRWSPADAADPYPAPDAVLEHNDERNRLLERLSMLDSRERTILMLRYGLEEDEPLTLKEIGLRLGVTREWVRKIEVQAVSKLHGHAIEQSPTPQFPAGSRRRSGLPNRRRRPLAAATSSPALPGSPRPEAKLNPRSVSQDPRQPTPPGASPGLYWLYGVGSRRSTSPE
jgi:RNA polymerase primary sigma factor